MKAIVPVVISYDFQQLSPSLVKLVPRLRCSKLRDLLLSLVVIEAISFPLSKSIYRWFSYTFKIFLGYISPDFDWPSQGLASSEICVSCGGRWRKCPNQRRRRSMITLLMQVVHELGWIQSCAIISARRIRGYDILEND